MLFISYPISWVIAIIGLMVVYVFSMKKTKLLLSDGVSKSLNS